MIKQKTISKSKIAKVLPDKYAKLAIKADEGAQLIKEANEMISVLNEELVKKNAEIKKLKSSWYYKFFTWLNNLFNFKIVR